MKKGVTIRGRRRRGEVVARGSHWRAGLELEVEVEEGYEKGERVERKDWETR